MDSLREALERLPADSPGVIEMAAKAVYLYDSDETRDDWAEQSPEFRDIYLSEVRLVLDKVCQALPHKLRLAA